MSDMNTFIFYQSKLGYENDYYEVVTDATIPDIQKHNTYYYHTWVSIEEMADNLVKDGFTISYSKIEPTKPYMKYRHDDNFVKLGCGNY